MANPFLRYFRFLLFNPKPMNQHEITEETEMEGQHTPLPDSGNGKSLSPLSPFPPVQSQIHE